MHRSDISRGKEVSKKESMIAWIAVTYNHPKFQKKQLNYWLKTKIKFMSDLVEDQLLQNMVNNAFSDPLQLVNIQKGMSHWPLISG